MKTKLYAALGRLAGLGGGWLQMACLIGLWWVCDVAVRAAGLPVPAGVVGMLLLVGLLATGRLPARWLRRGAGGLLDHMLLFFVPACMTLLDHPELVGVTGLKLLAVIVVGIVSVMAGTALIVEFSFRMRSHHVRQS
ncbi:LrgA family protein [Solidesulfovibrio carbinoliphilus subsp. oakridgensis]|uniref:LrgA family protein n=1 Tax=Solidesulfovibrio carbinoliphilus subsp. oakridgensis TaxID=694327 RepID=G7Q7W2_9BACT|nr:CidA/LrgA family protein [Solidesulfovibrio carbinoliphilus]EHJ47656.1 LrgA family protein [Solidesulfovibrio carbinoliphilus subsp. oakridgensis]